MPDRMPDRSETLKNLEWALSEFADKSQASPFWQQEALQWPTIVSGHDGVTVAAHHTSTLNELLRVLPLGNPDDVERAATNYLAALKDVAGLTEHHNIDANANPNGRLQFHDNLSTDIIEPYLARRYLANNASRMKEYFQAHGVVGDIGSSRMADQFRDSAGAIVRDALGRDTLPNTLPTARELFQLLSLQNFLHSAPDKSALSDTMAEGAVSQARGFLFLLQRTVLVDALVSGEPELLAPAMANYMDSAVAVASELESRPHGATASTVHAYTFVESAREAGFLIAALQEGHEDEPHRTLEQIGGLTGYDSQHGSLSLAKMLLSIASRALPPGQQPRDTRDLPTADDLGVAVTRNIAARSGPQRRPGSGPSADRGGFSGSNFTPLHRSTHRATATGWDPPINWGAVRGQGGAPPQGRGRGRGRGGGEGT